MAAKTSRLNAAATPPRRLVAGIAGSILAAAGIELLGRYLYAAHGVSYGVTGTLSLLALLIWGGSSVWFMRRMHGSRHVRGLVTAAAGLVVLSQAIGLCTYFEVPALAALMRRTEPLLSSCEEGFFVAGLALLFGGLYLSILEVHLAHVRAQQEGTKLADEIQERAHVEQALRESEEALRQAYAVVEQRVHERTATLQETNRRLEEEIAERTRVEQALRESEEAARVFGKQLRALHEVGSELAEIESFDKTCRAAVELGRQRLGFERLGIYFLGPDAGTIEGSFGVDEIGQVRDERRIQLRAEPDSTMGQILARRIPWVLEPDAPIVGLDGKVLARGWVATAALWDGEDVIGFVSADRLLSARPISERDCEILTLYASMLAHLCTIKRTDEVLRQNMERYQGLIDNANDLVWRIDTRGRITFVSPMAKRLIGYAAEDVLGRPFADFMTEESARTSQALLEQRLRGDPGLDGTAIEVGYRRKDGSLMHGEIVATPIFGIRGELIEIQGITRDISERKKAEAVLHHRLAMEEIVVAISARFIIMGAGEIDREITQALEVVGRFVGADRCHVALFSPNRMTVGRVHEWCDEGVEPLEDAYVGVPIETYAWSMGRILRSETIYVADVSDLPPEAGIERAAWEALGYQSIIGIPLVMGNVVAGLMGVDSRRKQGEYVEDDIRLLRLVGDVIANALARARTELSLRDSEVKHRTLLEGLSECVVRVRMPSGEMEYVSPAARDVFGYSPEEFLSRPQFIREIVHPESARYFEEEWAGLLEGEPAASFEYKVIDPEGRERWILQSFTVISNEEGKPIAAEGVCRNITEQKRAQQLIEEQRRRLAASSKMSLLGEIASNIAHEINNPLAIVSGSAEQLQKAVAVDPLPRDVIPKLTESILRNTSRIQAIVKGLRNLTREGAADPFQEASLKSIIEDTAALFQETLASQAIVLVVQDLPEALHIECRPTQIMEVLMNLLSNAVHAVEVGSEKWVSIAAADRGGLVEIAVTDAGPGIPPDMAAVVFDRFVTTKDPGKGTGLGLSICRRIVQGHNGTISVDPGCANTRFVVRLPKRQPSSE